MITSVRILAGCLPGFNLLGLCVLNKAITIIYKYFCILLLYLPLYHKNSPHCYSLPLHNSNGYLAFNQLYLPYLPNCFPTVEHLCLFLVFHNVNKTSLNTIVCARFFIVIIRGYFLGRASQKSTSHFFHCWRNTGPE